MAKVYGGPVSNGKPFFPGYMVGSEAVVTGGFGGGGSASGWMNVIAAAQPDRETGGLQPGRGYYAGNLAGVSQADYDYLKFDDDRDVHLLDDWGNRRTPPIPTCRNSGSAAVS